jgi:hypothetical protein
VLDNRKVERFGIRLPQEDDYLRGPLLKAVCDMYISAINHQLRSRIQAALKISWCGADLGGFF